MEGRKPSVNQPPFGGVNYPLVDRVPVGSFDLTDLLGDFWIGHRLDLEESPRPWSIKWLYGFGATPVVVPPFTPVHAQDLQIVDADDNVVLDTRDAATFSTQTWSTWLQIVEWRFADAIIRVVRLTAWAPEVGSPTYPTYFEPTDARLDARTIQRMPNIVRSITADGQTLSATSVIFRGRYNTTISAGETVEPDGGVRTTDITFDQFAGSGAGQFGPTCDDQLTDAPLHILGGATGDDRDNLSIKTDDCLRIEPVITQTGSQEDGLRTVQIRAGVVKVSDDCNPCYSCDDFIAVYEAARRIRNRIAALVQRLNTAQQLYEDGLARFERQRTCREGFSLRITQEAYCPCRLGIAIGFCNPLDVCMDNLVIPINFQYTNDDGCGNQATSTPASASIVPNSGFRGGFVVGNRTITREPYTVNGRWPYYWAYFPKVQPHQQAVVSFMLEFPDCTSADRIEIAIDAYSVPDLTGSAGGDPPIPGYTPGTGPAGPALDLRVVDCSVRAASGLRPICE